MLECFRGRANELCVLGREEHLDTESSSSSKIAASRVRDARATVLPILTGESDLTRYFEEIRRFPMLEPQEEYMLANRMRENGIGFKQLANAFLKCAAPDRLQELANSLTPRNLVTCGQKWLAHLTSFFTREREDAGCRHRLFFSQVEFCDNLVFRRRSALDKLGERLLDANRTIGQSNKITVIFGRKITKHYQGKLQTEIEDMNLPNPVIRSRYGNGFIKQ